MNLLDVVVISGLFFAAVRGFRQGALSQVAAFGGAGLGLVLGAVFAPRVASAVVDTPGPNLALFTLGVLLASIFIGQGIGFGIGLRLRHAAREIGAAVVDRIAGILVGAAGVLLVVWLLAASLAQGPFPTLANQVRSSQIVGAIGDTLPVAPDVFSRVANYLDQQGFPQVFSGLGGTTAPPVEPPSDAAVAAAQEAGAAATVQVQARGCGGISSGSGFVTQTGFIVTNAHVIAGGTEVSVRDLAGTTSAVTIHFDAELDLAVLRAADVQAPAIAWADTPADRDTQGATLGYPGGQRELNVSPARVRARSTAVGRDIYGRGLAEREILTLSSDVRRGDSGGPFVTSDGLVGGVVFAAAPDERGTGYALTAERVIPDVNAAISANAETGTGPCRF